MKVKDLLNKYYEKFKNEYEPLPRKLSELDSKIKTERYRLIDIGVMFPDNPNYHDRDKCSNFKYLKWQYNHEKEKALKLKNNMIKLNKILNNNEQLISLKRNKLTDFAYNKIILGIGKSAVSNSNSSINGDIKGSIGGSSFLGFGSVGGNIKGYIDGESSANYEEYILVKYKYNLDFEIEEFLFNVYDYINE